MSHIERQRERESESEREREHQAPGRLKVENGGTNGTNGKAG